MGEEDEKHKVDLTEQDKKDLEKFKKEWEKNKDNLKNGPISDRRLTDCFCCLFFIAFCIGLVAVNIIGWMNGQPANIVVGWSGPAKDID